MISVIIDGLNENIIQDNKVLIQDKGDVNHLKNVFRVKIDEIIRAVDGEYQYLLKIIEIDKKEIVCSILEKISIDDMNKVTIHIALGVLKNDKMNLAIQKLTEIGIQEIIPFYSKRCVVKLNEKKDKWDLISKEALKQCQGVRFTKILDPIQLGKIDFSSYDDIVVPYEASKDETLKKIISQMESPKKILYVIGPEGGFDESEIEMLKGKGGKIVTLGNRILRAETAAVVVGGVLINEFQ